MHADAFPRPAPGQDEGLGRAIAWAVVLHLVVVAILLLSPLLSWDPDRISVAGAPSMDAVLDVSDADRRAVTQALQAEPVPLPEPEPLPLPEPVLEDVLPPPQPLPEPVPEDAPVERSPAPQERVPDPAPVDQDEVRRDAEAERARVEREQEQQRRQEQIDLTERKRQQEAEEKRRLARQQLEQIRAEREKLEREQRLAQQRLQQISNLEERQTQPAPSAGSPPPGNQGVDTGLAARYAAALQEAILRNWTRPETVPIGQRCRIVIRQIPGGEVVSAEVDPSCPYDELGRRSVEAAVLKAQPLPYVGFESVFQRTLTLNFQAQDR